jgi:hypothetical protein
LDSAHGKSNQTEIRQNLQFRRQTDNANTECLEGETALTEEGTNIGLNRKHALENLNALGAIYIKTTNRLIELDSGRVLPTSQDEHNNLLHLKEEVSKQMAEIREWYTLNILESANAYSRDLRLLTVALVVLTGVLTILTAVLVWRTFY